MTRSSGSLGGMAGPDAAGFARCETDRRGDRFFGGDAGAHRRRGDEAMGCSALDGEALETAETTFIT